MNDLEKNQTLAVAVYIVIVL